ncbi:nuclear transport factor 2 family protein [Kribbella sancticallisti]|uniref:nuclear transport factor 2 family protein n=1 Tax=Kribbella sancticallisti TaxID=460087 RepID=UPI0031DF6506
MTAEQFRDLLARIEIGWSQGRPELAAACFHEDAIYVEPGGRQLYTGRQEIWELSGGSTPSAMRMEWHHVIFDEDRQTGAAEYTFKGRRQFHGLVLIKCQEGLIWRWREYQYHDENPWAAFIEPSEFE